jgi:hypothetical protein
MFSRRNRDLKAGKVTQECALRVPETPVLSPASPETRLKEASTLIEFDKT